MTDLKTHYSCAELAEMQLPGMPTTERNMREKALRENWIGQKRVGRGGGFEYRPPAQIMTQIKEIAVKKLATQSTEIAPIAQQLESARALIVNPGELKNWQRDIATARMAICSEVRRLAQVGGTERAIQTVIDLAVRGGLRPELQAMVPIANAKAGVGRALSRTTIYRWLKETENAQGGSAFARIAPKARETAAIPAWAPYLLSIYGQPQKPTLAFCVEKLPEQLPAGMLPPSYAAAFRFLQKMSNVDVQRGRMGSREIKTMLPFVRRDTKHMQPTDCYTADGHTFDAEVAHPAHGKPFRPEITTVLDIATRKAVGWSVGLAESTWAVLDAIRNACETCGIPSIFYVDNGSGYKNAAMSDESTGFMSRLGITLTHSLPYNSQARGIIERSHQTLWVKAAKMLPTYMGAHMDAQAKQKVFKLTRKAIKEVGKSSLLLGWGDFLTFCQGQVDAYNNRPHSSLPKIRAEDGTKRHQSPNEAWAEAVQKGFEAVPVEAYEAADLFRPYKTCKIIRCEIRLFNNTYFSHELEPYHGETAQVGYDIHDASRVWVRNRAGQLICIAEFEGNKRKHHSESVQDQANYKRAQGRIKRAEAKIIEAKEELNPPQLIEYQPVMELPPIQIEQPQPVEINVQPPALTHSGNVTPIVKRPEIFNDQIDKYRWLMSNKRAWTASDTRFLTKYVDGHQYFDMLAIYAFEDIAWTKEDEENAQKRLQQEEPEEPEVTAAQ
ncbi:MAG: DDE-type integrase/transposase/recombinase [Nitrosomonas sp.]|nr:DDE-type integrase/transposase/recombinase [Nitrosomonas sp.]